MNREIKQFEKYLLKNWGKKCKDYSALCGTCGIWRAFETIKSFESNRYHLTDWNKVLKIRPKKNIRNGQEKTPEKKVR